MRMHHRLVFGDEVPVEDRLRPIQLGQRRSKNLALVGRSNPVLVVTRVNNTMALVIPDLAVVLVNWTLVGPAFLACIPAGLA